MIEKTTIKKSLIEQIIDEMFENIEKHEEFDMRTIQNLKQLASTGDIKKSSLITNTVKVTSGKT